VEREFWDKHWNRAWAENAHFWQRIPHKDLTGLRVLDFGCGLGGLAVQVMQRGAESVLGLEMDPEYCDYGKRKIEEDFPQFAERVHIVSTALEEVPDAYFDVVISKDVLEHVIGLREVFSLLVAKLKPGGEMLLGFGPLWHSPFGDHGITRGMTRGVSVPWLHLLLGDRRVLSQLNRKRARDGAPPYGSLQEAGFNQLPIHEMEDIIRSSGLEIASFQINLSENPVARAVAAIPIPDRLSKYFTRTVYCRLRRPSPDESSL
jgi:SAM-dependent methyltransferase